jgi:hypothetical protein
MNVQASILTPVVYTRRPTDEKGKGGHGLRRKRRRIKGYGWRFFALALLKTCSALTSLNYPYIFALSLISNSSYNSTSNSNTSKTYRECGCDCGLVASSCKIVDLLVPRKSKDIYSHSPQTDLQAEQWKNKQKWQQERDNEQ